MRGDIEQLLVVGGVVVAAYSVPLFPTSVRLDARVRRRPCWLSAVGYASAVSLDESIQPTLDQRVHNHADHPRNDRYRDTEFMYCIVSVSGSECGRRVVHPRNHARCGPRHEDFGLLHGAAAHRAPTALHFPSSFRLTAWCPVLVRRDPYFTSKQQTRWGFQHSKGSRGGAARRVGSRRCTRLDRLNAAASGPFGHTR